MGKFKTLLGYELREVIISRWFLFYVVGLNLILHTLLYFTNQVEQVYGSVLNAVLYFNFIAIFLFSLLTWQNSLDFVSLVLSQPVNRRDVFWARLVAFIGSVSLFTGSSLVIQLVTSMDAIPLLHLLGTQLAVQVIAAGLGFMIAIAIEDRLKAVAVAAALLLVLGFALDALSLGIMIQFSAFPLERTILLLSLLNPLSLLKYQNLMEQNNSLWIGYAGVLLTRSWHSGLLQVLSVAALIFWMVVPTALSAWFFNKKDL